MKIISWNVNSLKSLLNNNFKDVIIQINADIICLQETKISNENDKIKIEGYYHYFNFTKRAGYSGVAIYTKIKPERVWVGIEEKNEEDQIENVDIESRVITLEYNNFFIVSVYVPFSQRNGSRVYFRERFDNSFKEYVEKLNCIKNVIVCGDFNICHKKIDICNLEKHNIVETFADDTKERFNSLLEIGLIDTYRYMHPQMRKYTFWTNDIEKRENCDCGWRLDYILASEELRKNIREVNILSDIYGSDHCPVELIVKNI